VALVDHGSLQLLIDACPDRFDYVVVYDPPVTTADRDALAAVTLPLHLTFGAAEARFARAAAQAIANVRGTLGAAWKPLQAGVTDAVELDHLLWGGEHTAHLHAAPALTHALGELTRRGLLTLDAANGTVSTSDTVPATS